MAVSLFRSLGRSPDPILFSRVWKRGQRLTDSNGTPVSVNTLEPGSTLIVFPEGKIGDERAQTVLIRVDERLIPRDRRASWAPKGYLAYSRVCTHAGCPVGLYEVTTCQLMCPCHQSTFDVLRGARPTGGPAARPLPQLPLYADADGTLRAADGFTTPPGPGFWGMPPSPPDWGTS
jgi:ubiquinol-cytochrome c reductase iron-sulfur subunit